MGLFGETFKAAKEVATGFGSKVLEVARNIKKTANEFVGAIAGKEGIVAQAYGKIKSFGSMVLDRVFPNASPEEIQSLQSATSSAKQAGGTEFVQNFTGALKSASPEGAAAVVTENKSITKSFRDSLTNLGGDIKDATKRIYDNTVEAVFGKGKADPQAIAKKSTISTSEISKASSSRFLTQEELALKALNKNPEFLKMASFENKPPIDLIKEQASFIGKDIDIKGMTLAENPEFVKMSNFSSIDTQANPELRSLVSTTTPQSLIEDQKNFLQEREGLKRLAGVKTPEAPSLLNTAVNWAKENKGSIADALGAGFGAFGDLQEGGFTPSSGKTPAQLSAQRGGIGGEGSSGGSFLSAAQRAFFSQQASALGRLG